MKSIFAILLISAPLWLTPIIIYVIYKASRHMFGKKHQFVATIAVVGLLLLLITGQEITASIYHSYLCNNKYGYKNYSKIKLPQEYWYADGSPKFVEEDNKINFEMLNAWFTSNTATESVTDSFIKINKHSYIYYDKKNNKVAEKVNFVRYFGWVKEYTFSQSSAVQCNYVLSGDRAWNRFNKKDDQDRRNFYLNMFEK